MRAGDRSHLEVGQLGPILSVRDWYLGDAEGCVMALETAIVIGIGMVVVAALYSSVGHGGGSGYLAVMALFTVAPEVMRPAALVLNIVVASLAAWTFLRRGAFSWRALWPLAVTAVPMAFLGGQLSVPGVVYKPLLAVVLLWSAVYLVSPGARPCDDPTLIPPVGPALGAGAVLGLLSGLTGIGGGIFLSPLLLFARWAPTRQVSGVAAAFILLNSSAGLAGQVSTVVKIPWTSLTVWVPLVLVGGVAGARYGSRTPNTKNIYRLLGVVLAVAAGKMLLTLGG